MGTSTKMRNKQTMPSSTASLSTLREATTMNSVLNPRLTVYTILTSQISTAQACISLILKEAGGHLDKIGKQRPRAWQNHLGKATTTTLTNLKGDYLLAL